jgi:uncharacterized Zn-binding protein involved in type VI secretion
MPPRPGQLPGRGRHPGSEELTAADPGEPAPPAAGPGPGPWRGRLAAAAGSVAGLVTASLLGSALGFANKAACWGGDWNSYLKQFQAHCYTDIYPLYFSEQLSAGKTPYLGHPVEYPVVIGGAMQAAAWLVRPVTDPYLRGKAFFEVTLVLLAACAVAAVLATGYLAGKSRGWTGWLVALAPGLVLCSFINWDLIAVALAALGMAAWARRRHILAGVLLGLAVATKFYPLLFFGPLLLLCLRAGRMRAFAVTFGSAVVAWLAVNLPVALAAPTGWARFYQLSASRPADWGSIWYFFETEHWPVLGTTSLGALNLLSLAVFAALCLAIAVLTLAAPRRPRVPQLFFLVLAAFLLSNKVWSPQYVLWLVPLAVLARPRLWSYALWQLAEAGYFFAIWAYLISVSVPGGSAADGGIGPGLYFAALLARFAAVALLCGLVVRDIARPGADPVRAAGGDDPAGGVLAGAPDRWRLRLPVRAPGQPEPSCSRSQAMSAPGSGVSQISGAPAARATSRMSDGSMVPSASPAWRSRPEPNSSRELLQWIRSIRPVMALTRSTMPARSSPPA